MTDEEKFKILIVDDEKANINALSYILKSKYVVLAAKDGETAIEVAQNNQPDLILLDIIMPGMSGFETLLELKNCDLTRGIPVIFITGRDSVEDEAKGLALGAVDYMTKPFHPSIVEARVRTHLQIVQYIHAIERLCMVDALTNIPNRRYFDEHLSIEWDRAMREKKPLSVLMIDIDNFKIYNDTYGHSQGDTLLKNISQIFKQTLKRPADFVSRWGGEEFTVLLPDTDSEGAMEVAEHIRANVEHAVTACPDGRETRVTVSIGVNSEYHANGNSIHSFVAGADKALYSAKAAGKNKVMLL